MIFSCLREYVDGNSCPKVCTLVHLLSLTPSKQKEQEEITVQLLLAFLPRAELPWNTPQKFVF